MGGIRNHAPNSTSVPPRTGNNISTSSSLISHHASKTHTIFFSALYSQSSSFSSTFFPCSFVLFLPYIIISHHASTTHTDFVVILFFKLVYSFFSSLSSSFTSSSLLSSSFKQSPLSLSLSLIHSLYPPFLPPFPSHCIVFFLS